MAEFHAPDMGGDIRVFEDTHDFSNGNYSFPAGAQEYDTYIVTFGVSDATFSYFRFVDSNGFYPGDISTDGVEENVETSGSGGLCCRGINTVTNLETDYANTATIRGFNLE